MIAFSVASKQEWSSLVELLNVEERKHSPFGEFFFHQGGINANTNEDTQRNILKYTSDIADK